MTESNSEFEPMTEAEIAESVENIDAEMAEAVEEAAGVDNQINELTADLQRLQAEYSNYRKRVERDRFVARENAIGEVLNSLISVLDDFSRADEHGELTGALKSASDAVQSVTTKFGLETFGAVGEEFDPAQYEALTHKEAEGEGPTRTVIIAVYQVGYRHAGRVLRPARVAVEEIAAE
jgi:molecular chaperone GrpE